MASIPLNEYFNNSVKVDFVATYISGDRCEALNTQRRLHVSIEIDRAVRKNASADTGMLETEWLYRHGASKLF